MSWFRSICFAVIACMLFSSQVLTASENEKLKTFEGDGNLTLSLENGSTGILMIHYVMVLPTRNARISSYILFADRFQFSAFASAVIESEGSVVADLNGTEISIRLSSNSTRSGLYGHIIGTNEQVYVVPAAP